MAVDIRTFINPRVGRPAIRVATSYDNSVSDLLVNSKLALVYGDGVLVAEVRDTSLAIPRGKYSSVIVDPIRFTTVDGPSATAAASAYVRLGVWKNQIPIRMYSFKHADFSPVKTSVDGGTLPYPQLGSPPGSAQLDARPGNIEVVPIDRFAIDYPGIIGDGSALEPMLTWSDGIDIVQSKQIMLADDGSQWMTVEPVFFDIAEPWLAIFVANVMEEPEQRYSRFELTFGYGALGAVSQKMKVLFWHNTDGGAACDVSWNEYIVAVEMLSPISALRFRGVYPPYLGVSQKLQGTYHIYGVPLSRVSLNNTVYDEGISTTGAVRSRT